MLNVNQQLAGSSSSSRIVATCTLMPQHVGLAHRRGCKPQHGNIRVVVRASSNDQLQQQVPELLLQSQAAAAVDAYRSGTLAFGFSAGGLLFPYYLGVAQQLEEMNILQQHTQLAGASAGSLIVACIKSGLPLSTIQDACFALADDCRANGTRHRLRHVLEGVLRDVLPTDVAERCSGRVHVAVTTVAPRFKPKLVSRFRSRNDLISALLTSCHIPWYFDGSLITTFRKVPCFDGGITNFLPDVPGATTCRVCCLPSKQMARIGNISISPDAFGDWPHSLQTMLGWAFEPADQEMLLALIEQGRQDAATWARRSGVAQVAATNNSSITGARSSSTDASSAQPLVILPGAAAGAGSNSSKAPVQVS